MRKVLLISVIFMVAACSSEKREIMRQEELINSFLLEYFDNENYKNSVCKVYEEYNQEFYSCIKDMIEENHSEVMREEAVDMTMNLTSTQNIMRYMMGEEYEVDYELITPETLEFPNVFRVLISHEINGEELRYYINIKVENNLIVELKDAKN